MNAFFEHENHAWPPSLAENDSMRHGNEADFLKCLEPLVQHTQMAPEVDVTFFDGAALVHKLEPKKATTLVNTFKDYADIVFIPYLLKQLQLVRRVDVVWDFYAADSLKAHTRQCRGNGSPLCVTEKTRIPNNWKSFLRVDSNKAELFQSLTSAIESATAPEDKLLVTTKKENVVLTNTTLNVSALLPCPQEADHCLMLHCAHAHQHGSKRIMVHATDTDVLLLAIATASMLEESEIWLAFGHAKSFRYIAAHSITAVLGDDRSKALLFVHAVSGCDTVSSFFGIGKKTVWDVWNALPNLTALFKRLSQTPQDITHSEMEELERFVVLLFIVVLPKFVQ